MPSVYLSIEWDITSLLVDQQIGGQPAPYPVPNTALSLLL